jgi:hypothetical protein
MHDDISIVDLFLYVVKFFLGKKQFTTSVAIRIQKRNVLKNLFFKQKKSVCINQKIRKKLNHGKIHSSSKKAHESKTSKNLQEG